jgi:hypothetical protein
MLKAGKTRSATASLDPVRLDRMNNENARAEQAEQ